MKRIIREPFAWFTLGGAVIFFAYGTLAPRERPAIVVTEQVIADLVEERRLALDRDVTPEERDALIDRFVADEMLLNEAIVRGLYRLDPIVRRRLARKMEFLLGDEPPEPTAADLQLLQAASPDVYRMPSAITFEHVYFTSDRAAAETALEAIRNGRVAAADVGEIFWLGQRLERYNSRQLVILMGWEFDKALKRLSIGTWQGPIRSGRGWHLVRILERHASEPLPEAERLRRLTADWKSAWRARQRAETLAALRQEYQLILPGQSSDG